MEPVGMVVIDFWYGLVTGMVVAWLQISVISWWMPRHDPNQDYDRRKK